MACAKWLRSTWEHCYDLPLCRPRRNERRDQAQEVPSGVGPVSLRRQAPALESVSNAATSADALLFILHALHLFRSRTQAASRSGSHGYGKPALRHRCGYAAYIVAAVIRRRITPRRSVASQARRRGRGAVADTHQGYEVLQDAHRTPELQSEQRDTGV